MEPKQIMWLENDSYWVDIFAEELSCRGYEVDRVEEVLEAEDKLRSHRYDLIILDVMIPVLSKQDEEVYPPDKTDKGRKAGLYFYERMRKNLERSGTKVFVFTIRGDHEVVEEFKKAGLAANSFANKLELRDPSEFVTKVQEILED